MIGRTVGGCKVIARIGAGGMGEVYRALDLKNGETVALKLLLKTGFHQPGAVERFLREATAASSLHHPNIVRLHRTGVSPYGHYIVMEYVAGTTLRPHVRRAVSLEKILLWGRQVAGALACAHQAGIVHRDVKPENIMIEPGEVSLKLLDFGLARVIQDARVNDGEREITQTASNLLLGTLRYLSPEHVSGQRVGTKADVFALGIVLYEMATGLHPFDCRDFPQILNAITSYTPVSPSTLAPTIPRSLQALIESMLEKRPQDRPSALQAETALTELPAEPGRSFSARSPKPIQHIVGRTIHINLLHGYVQSAKRGTGQIVLVEGESGLGKTTLIENFIEQASTGEGCRVGSGRASQRGGTAETCVAIRESLHGLIQSDPTGYVARILKILAPTWYKQVTPGKETLIVARKSPSRVGSWERMKLDLVAFLQEASREQCILLFLDDMHWADESTVDLLRFLSERLHSMPVLLVVTTRPATASRFSALKTEMRAKGVWNQVPLDFLSSGSIREFIDLECPENKFPTTLEQILHDRSEGNPLFMVEIWRHLVSQHVVERNSGTWTLTHPVEHLQVFIPATLQELIVDRVRALGQAERRILEVASLQGDSFDSAIITAATNGKAPHVERLLSSLRNTSLITSLGEAPLPDTKPNIRFKFTHVLFQNVISAMMLPTERRVYSASIAESLKRAYAGHENAVAAQLAFLYESAHEYEHAVHYYSLAAHHSAETFGYAECIRSAERGLALLDNLTDSPEQLRYRLALNLVQGAALTVRQGYAGLKIQQVHEQVRQLCARSGSDAAQFQSLWALSGFCAARLEFRAAHQYCDQMRTFAKTTANDGLILQASLQSAIIDFYSGNFRKACHRAQTTIRLYCPDKHSAHAKLYGYDPKVGALCFLGRSLWALGHTSRAVEMLEKAVESARAIAHPYSLMWATFHDTALHFTMREIQGIRERAETVINVATEHGFPFWIPMAQCMIGWSVALELGDFDQGIQVMEEALRIESLSGAKLARPANLVYLAEVLGKAGKTQQALACLDQAIEAAETGARYWESEAYRVRSEFTPDLVDAERLLRIALQIATEQNAGALIFRASATRARRLHESGNTSKARRILTTALRPYSNTEQSPDLRAARLLLQQMTTALSSRM